MIWQDAIFAFGAVVSVLSLLPTLLNRLSVVPLKTSITASSLGAVYSMTFLSLGMPISATGSAVISLVWFGIAIARRPQPQPEPVSVIEGGTHG